MSQGNENDGDNSQGPVRSEIPYGHITEAVPPRPVRVLLHWYGAQSYAVDAWAMAWTRTEVLIFYREAQVQDPVTAWVRTVDVRRR